MEMENSVKEINQKSIEKSRVGKCWLGYVCID